MSQPDSGKLPESIIKRDGRRVPFEPDQISQALFAAGESIGQPDAFLARELTDSVLHFLSQETGAETPTTGQLAELIIKVVRELGQPDLARAFELHAHKSHADAVHVRKHYESAQGMVRPSRSGASDPAEVTFRFSPSNSPAQVTTDCLTKFSLHAIFSRDLRAAISQGFLALEGLGAPDELTAVVLESIPADLADWIEALRQAPARNVIVDSPELKWKDFEPAKLTRMLVKLAALSEALGRTITLNLNCVRPPGWAREHAQGPLFNVAPPSQALETTATAERVLEGIACLGKNPPLRVEWHLSETAFADADRSKLESLLRLAMENRWLSFVFDRPKQDIVLGESIDRRHSGVFAKVGLTLPRLFDMTEGRLEAFLEKLPILARMGIRAAVQKRNYLRRRSQEDPRLSRGFLLDRARVLIFPAGLDAVVCRFLGQGITQSRLSLDLGRRIIDTLWRTLETEGKNANLDISFEVFAENYDWVRGSAGATESVSCEGQLSAFAALLVEAGVQPAFVGIQATPNLAAMMNVLQMTWKKQTSVARLVFSRA